MGIEFSLAMPRDAIGIPMVRRVVGDTLRSLGVTEECVADILLATSEAARTPYVMAGRPSDTRSAAPSATAAASCASATAATAWEACPGNFRAATPRTAEAF